MRRSLLCLLTVVAIGGLLLVTGCERDYTLRIVSINRGQTLRSDIADFFVYFDPVDSEFVTISQYMPDSVEIELQYVEIGAGLPTWTPYQAQINKATIKYTGTSEDAPDYSQATLALNHYVRADATGKTTTTFHLTAISSSFKEMWFSEFLQEPPPNGEYDVVDLIDATITFTGYDSVLYRDVRASGKFSIEVGNFYDDLNRFGQ